MATTTTNYGLKKPESTDLVSVVPFNENFDILDTTLKDLNNDFSGLDTALNGLNTALNGLKFKALTQSEYNAISSKDPNTLYFVKS